MIYQQLKVVDLVTKVKGVFRANKKFYKLIIGNSRIALLVEEGKITIGIFLFNVFFEVPIVKF